MDAKTSEFVVKGGPPVPIRHCASCGAELMGHPEHCMDEQKKLFCNPTHRAEFAAKQSA